MGRLKGLFILDEEARDLVYGPDDRRRVADLVDLVAPPQTHTSIVRDLPAARRRCHPLRLEDAAGGPGLPRRRQH